MTIAIRAAQLADAAAIAALHNCHLHSSNSTSERGFLLEPTTVEQVRAQLASGPDNLDYWLAITAAGEIVGSVAIARPQLNVERISHWEWHAPDRRAMLAGPSHRYIQNLATHPDWTGRGIARQLYATLYRQYPDCCFSAFVAMQPLANARSRRFHQQQGFTHAATFRASEFLGLRDYVSWLLYRGGGQASD